MSLSTLWVTRPQPQASAWCEQLTRLGVPAQALTLLEIAVLDTPELQQARGQWADMDALMFVSPNATTAFFRGVQIHIPVTPQRPLCLATGPGTVQALQQTGVPPGLIVSPPAQSTQFDSEALWECVRDRSWQDRRVLFIRGTGLSNGRDWLMQQFTQAGALVRSVLAYERRPPAPGPGLYHTIAHAFAAQDIWLFSSSETIQQLSHLAPDSPWHQGRCICTHPRIAQTARAAGWGIVTESRPSTSDVARAWAGLCHAQ
jgi:uroporphyrinogen-III synthase